MLKKRWLCLALGFATAIVFSAAAPSKAGAIAPQTADLPSGDSRTPIQIGGHFAAPEPLQVADGVYEVTLLVRSQPAAGEILWEQSYPNVRIRNGSIRSPVGGPLGDLEISGAWLEILVDGRLVGGPIEINANGQSLYTQIYEGHLRFGDCNASHCGSGWFYYVQHPNDSSKWIMQLTNSSGSIGLIAGEGGVGINSEGTVDIKAPLVELRGGSNATLADGSGCRREVPDVSLLGLDVFWAGLCSNIPGVGSG